MVEVAPRDPHRTGQRKILGENLARPHGIDVETEKTELGVSS
jgi:hypothetical protein